MSRISLDGTRTGSWTPEEIAILLTRWSENRSNAEISIELGRPENAVAIKASRLKLPTRSTLASIQSGEALKRNPKGKYRDCLGCKVQFFSEHAGNRFCDCCTNAKPWRSYGRSYSLTGR